jgi:hypothetical protein
MPALLMFFIALRRCQATVMAVLLDMGRLACIRLRSRRALAAENLFLRKQLAGFRREKLKRGAPTIPRVESWQLQPKCSHGAIRSGM